jgi:hypothetical protein
MKMVLGKLFSCFKAFLLTQNNLLMQDKENAKRVLERA